MITRALVLLLALFCASAAHAQAKYSPPFPRLAIYAIGGPHDYETSARQNELARYNVVIINAYPGWQDWKGTTWDQIAKNLKAKNPNNKLFLYTFNNEFDTGSTHAGVWPEILQKLNDNRWWLYQDGSPAKSTFGVTHYLTNPTLYANKDANGQRFIDWIPQHLVTKLNGANSAIDGFFLDCTFWRPHRAGDWNNDGVTDDPWSNPNVGRWLREGLRQYFTSLHTLMPGKLQLGNVTDWADDGSVVTEFQGVMNGGLLEGIMGVDWGVESFRGFNAMMAAYRKSMATFGDPKLGIMHMAGDPGNFQELRYSLGATMLDDGYFAYSRRIAPGDFETHDAFWFDEYDVNLGQATSSPPTTAWQKGVYRRDFENGIVLVNPKGNGQQEVTLEGEFRRIAGKQDPSVNNGQLSTKIVLKDRDGIVLLRPNPVKRPASPTNVRVD